MLNWKVENNVISNLFYKGVNLINPWGIETADSWSFFSMENGIGYRYEVLSQEISTTDKKLSAKFQIKMREGLWILETSDEILDNRVLRTAKLTCLEDSLFMDFVVRFRFKRECFEQGLIGQETITHSASNIYHQHSVSEATLKGKDLEVTVNLIEAECLGKFKPQLYIRDHQDEWVIHARMMPIVDDKSIIKLCSKYFKTSPLPQAVTWLLLKLPSVKTYLWYHAEHTPYVNRLAKIFSPNAFPLVRLKKGQTIYWKVEMRIDG